MTRSYMSPHLRKRSRLYVHKMLISCGERAKRLMSRTLDIVWRSCWMEVGNIDSGLLRWSFEGDNLIW